jgi:SNF2 family DNA or RNA helicase
VTVSSSTIEPLPDQISAVYEHMLSRQPMRFLLADDPGAGKTIMAGLLIKEQLILGELERCLIVAPGSLTEQWQDELKEKFELLTRDLINATGLGNPFEQRPLLIARMDQLARDEELQQLSRVKSLGRAGQLHCRRTSSAWSRPRSGIWWSATNPTA